MVKRRIVIDLLQIFKSGVAAVLPESLIKRTIIFSQNNQDLKIAGEIYNIQNKNVYLVGTGKAVQNMAREVENILQSKIKYGIISIPVGSLNKDTKNSNVSYYEGAENNLPDVDAENTSRKVKDLVSSLGKNDLLLVLISGGGSALLPLPKEPITLTEKTNLIKMLGNSGADIKELNTVRKKLSDIKGGELAIKAQPSQVISLILSDIVGDPLDLIASGPTVENEDDFLQAKNIIDKYNLSNNLPKSIVTVLNEKVGTKPFPKNNVRNIVIGSNKMSTEAAINQAISLNYYPIDLSTTITGNIMDVSKEYAKLTKLFCDFLIGKLDKNNLMTQVHNLNITGLNLDKHNIDSIKDKDLCLIFGGEITVEVKGTGKGGRNQQLALEFSKQLNNFKTGFDNFDIYFLSAGTDGIDGPTDAAGAIGYLNLFSDAIEQNIDVDKYINNNDSYNFYKKFHNGEMHVITGHTNTNVMDMHLIVIKKK